MKLGMSQAGSELAASCYRSLARGRAGHVKIDSFDIPLL